MTRSSSLPVRALARAAAQVVVAGVFISTTMALVAAPSTPPKAPSASPPASATDAASPSRPESPPVPAASERVTSPGVTVAGPRVIDPAIDALLDELEHAGDSLRDFQARMVYEKVDGLAGGLELRYGRVIHRQQGAARREDGGASAPAAPPDPSAEAAAATGERGSLLAIFFDEFVAGTGGDGTGRRDTIDQRYIFADGWLVEIDSDRRQFIKRQIVPPGKTFDPLKLGEGPFPLPVGQKKSEVLARFLVSPAPVPTARLLKGLDVSTLRSIRLVPLEGTSEARDFTSVDLYYDPATFLPIGVVAEAPDGSVKTVRLRDVQRNTGISKEDQQAISVETPDPRDWIIDIRPWANEG